MTSVAKYEEAMETDPNASYSSPKPYRKRTPRVDIFTDIDPSSELRNSSSRRGYHKERRRKWVLRHEMVAELTARFCFMDGWL